MRKIYLLLPLVMLTTLAMGQIDFTFEVDMNNETVSANGVHVAGSFQGWSPSATELTDTDLDGIYSATVSIDAGGFEYKFINGNDWPDAEGIPEVCQVGGGNGNRYFQLSDNSAATTGAIIFGGSAPDGMVAVKLQVGLLNGPDAEGAHVTGSMANWIPDSIPLYNVYGNVYAVSYAVTNATSYSYKFLTGDAWGSDETGTPDSCSTEGNRTITMEGDSIVPDVCFNSCGPCQASYITFRVDMSLACLDLTDDAVHLMGTATDWGTGEPMNDDDGDDVWEVEIPVQSGDWAYKFRVDGTDNWEGYPGDRMITVEVGVDSILPAFCWSSPDVCSDDAFAPSEVTFTVNMADSTLDGANVYVMGDFTGWQNGALMMTDNSDGTYSVTVAEFCPQEGRFKFAYGTAPNDSLYWVEENGDFSEIGGCGEDNGTFSDNRVLVRTSTDPMTVCYTFNTCTACLVGVEEVESLNRVEIYPNPTNDVINIVFDKHDQYDVRIMDISGKVIYTNQVNAERLVISGDNMGSGIYFVQIIDASNNTVTKKLVVK